MGKTKECVKKRKKRKKKRGGGGVRLMNFKKIILPVFRAVHNDEEEDTPAADNE